MVEALVYILFSIVEGLIIVFFSFGLFRIRIMDYWKEIVVTVSAISAATYYYSLSESLSTIAPLLNSIALFLALVLIFRISLLHSLYISVTGLVSLLLIQLALASIASNLLNMSLEEIKSLDWMRFTFQGVSDAFLLTLSLYLRKKRMWFVFVPYTPELTFKLSKSNVILLLSSVFGIILLSTFLNLNNIVIGVILSLLCISNLIYVGIKIERGEEV